MDRQAGPAYQGSIVLGRPQARQTQRRDSSRLHSAHCDPLQSSLPWSAGVSLGEFRSCPADDSSVVLSLIPLVTPRAPCCPSMQGGR